MGLAKLPSSSWTVNSGWLLAANLAADIDAWTRLLGLHDIDDLALAEPDTLATGCATGKAHPVSGLIHEYRRAA
jgi:hypothetical protein